LVVQETITVFAIFSVPDVLSPMLGYVLLPDDHRTVILKRWNSPMVKGYT
jgi:hypothetical protein